MFKIIIVLLLGIVCNVWSEESQKNGIISSNETGRQKRLLFYDEDGNLVKTFTNPFLRDYVMNPEKIPVFGNAFNPFLGLLRPTIFGSTPTHYMIPVSNEIIQQINKDPVYQNKLMLLPPKDAAVEPNPLCNGKRNQIPSPSKCNNFLNCWDGWAFEQECPDGLMFSNLGYCDYPDKVNCYDRRSAEESHYPCSKDKEMEVYRSDIKCGEFYVCVNQAPIKFKCPADLSYNPELGICDYPERVNCVVQESSTTIPSSSASLEKHITSDASTESPSTSSPSNPSTITLTNTRYNSQTWQSTHIAMSRADAIRQLKLRQLANINSL